MSMAMVEPLPSCCVATVRAVSSQREDARCTCGERYRWSGAVADARVRVADAAHLRPSSTPPVARLTHVEDDELVRVRGLLCYLRPDKGGPLGWPADGSPPASAGSNWTPAIRIQTSVEVPAILPGAFALTGGAASRAPHTSPGTTAHWLQRHGTLKRGLRALYEACGVAMETPEVRARWDKLSPAAIPGAQQLYGRKLVLAAVRSWRNEPEPGATVEEVEALASAQRAEIVGMVVRQTERASSAAGAAIDRALDSRGGRGSNAPIEPALSAVEVRPAGADAETPAP
mgnify:CR=1 FL=1